MARSRSLPDWDESRFVETDQYIEVDGVRLNIPFVEKPLSAEDHNVYIYFGKEGGSKRLFRKVKNQSSTSHPDVWQVRRDGSYLYEEFMLTEGLQDIKVYTVGPDYVHIEVRKSPHVNGVVDRNKHGKVWSVRNTRIYSCSIELSMERILFWKCAERDVDPSQSERDDTSIQFPIVTYYSFVLFSFFSISYASGGAPRD
jgi:hypothetical protein